MLSFKEFLEERVLNIGLRDEGKDMRNKYSSEIHGMLHKAYSQLPDGYGGLGSGTEEEHKSIQSDIHNPNHIIKLHRRGDHISHVAIYRKTPYGRKMIAAATDGSLQGKKDLVQNTKEDNKMTDRNSYAEVSGKPEAIMRKVGVPVVPNHKVSKIIGKDITPHKDGEYYDRLLGKDIHTKVTMGHPKG